MNPSQLGALLWLRWRLTRNRMLRDSPLQTVVLALFVVLIVMASFGLTIAGFLVGLSLGRAEPTRLMIIWDGIVFTFLFFSLGSLMVELQRSEIIDIPRLLHLPVGLGQVFLLNYVASHATPAILILLPAMLALGFGLAVAAGPMMALAIPLVVGVVLAVTAWTYLVRGWLSSIMMSKRRRRAISVWIIMAFVAFGQAPNLITHSELYRAHRGQVARDGTSERPLPDSWRWAHLVVPFGWPGYASMRLRQGEPGAPIALTAGAFALMLVGLATAYRSTVRFYRGTDRPRRTSKRALTGPPVGRETILLERRIPGLADDTAALTLANFRSLTRAPEMKLVLIMPLVFAFGLVIVRFGGRPRSQVELGETLDTALGSIVAGIAMFGIAPTMSNAFGLDRDGFRSLVLLPTPRDRVLLAKNLAFAPFVAGLAGFLLVVAVWSFKLSWRGAAVALLQIPTLFLIYAPICNCFAILLPYRMAAGSLNAQRPKPAAILAAIGTMMLTPVLMAPTLIPSALRWLFARMGWARWLPVEVMAAAGILAVAAGLYAYFLPRQGRLFARREQSILREVTTKSE